MDDRQSDEATCWYLSHDGRRHGPYSFSVLLDAAEGGQIAPEDLVWRVGWQNWHSAKTVPGLISPPPLPSERPPRRIPSKIDVKPEDAVNTNQANQRQRATSVPATRLNYFVRHWRGELSLPISYWVNGILAAVLTYALALTLALTFGDQNNAVGLEVLVAFGAYLIGATGILVWQVTGVWRSASQHAIKGRTSFWAGAAKFMVIVGVLRFAVDFSNYLWPILSENTKIALGDSRFGEHHFRILRNGTELEFSGGINIGTAKDFERMLDAASQVKVLHLNSIGGRIADADLMAAKVSARGLTTYVSDQCLSACTHVFLAGRERWIGRRAKLGFHRPDFPGLSSEDVAPLIDQERQRLLSFGIPSGFVTKVLSTPATSIWTPTADELLSSHIISGVADDSQFAASGELASIAATEPDRIRKSLLRIPVYATLQRVEPETFDKMLQQLSQGYEQGATEEEIFSSARAIFAKSLARYLPRASDAQLSKMIEILLSYMQSLRTVDPESCVALSDASKGAHLRVNLTDKFPEISKQELQLYDDIISANAGIQTPTQRQIEPSLNQVVSNLAGRFDSNDIDLLDKLTLLPSEYRRYCEVEYAFFSEIRRLPKSNGAALMRYLLAQN